MTFHLRRLRDDDAETLGPLHNRIWRSAYTGLLPDEVLAARDDADSTRRWRDRGQSHEAFGAPHEGATTWVADLDDTPVGWISIGPARDEDAPTAIELWSLYVAPEHQGSGVAEQLLEIVPLSDPLYLWVLAGNGRAVAFYRKMGFATDGMMKQFLNTGAIECRMQRL